MRGGFDRFAHKLALATGHVDVDRMLRSMSSLQFAKWRVFDELEPFGEERDDYRFASICQALWNIARNVRMNPNGWPLTDFLVRFGDAPLIVYKHPQTLEYQEMLIDSWVFTNNAIVSAKEARK